MNVTEPCVRLLDLILLYWQKFIMINWRELKKFKHISNFMKILFSHFVILLKSSINSRKRNWTDGIKYFWSTFFYDKKVKTRKLYKGWNSIQICSTSCQHCYLWFTKTDLIKQWKRNDNYFNILNLKYRRIL